MTKIPASKEFQDAVPTVYSVGEHTANCALLDFKESLESAAVKCGVEKTTYAATWDAATWDAIAKGNLFIGGKDLGKISNLYFTVDPKPFNVDGFGNGTHWVEMKTHSKIVTVPPPYFGDFETIEKMVIDYAGLLAGLTYVDHEQIRKKQSAKIDWVKYLHVLKYERFALSPTDDLSTKTSDILRSARGLIAEEGWITGAMHNARGYCIMGALAFATNTVSNRMLAPILKAIGIPQNGNPTRDASKIISWNDDRIFRKTPEQVLRMFDTAIAIAEDIEQFGPVDEKKILGDQGSKHRSRPNISFAIEASYNSRAGLGPYAPINVKTPELVGTG